MRHAETVLGIIQERGRRRLPLEDIYRHTAVQDKRPLREAPLIYAAFKRVNVSFEVCAPICCPNHAKSKTVWLAASSGSGGIAKG